MYKQLDHQQGQNKYENILSTWHEKGNNLKKERGRKKRK